MGRVQLRLLGPVQIERDGGAVHGFESRKAVALLCYLALQDQPRTRSHLAELFWPEKPEPRGRGNLSRVLHNLAQLLPGCLETTRQTVGITQGEALWLDVVAFETLAAQGDPASLAAAADLYRGDLLADLLLEDCPEFEQWLEGAREHWRQRQTQILQRLVEYHLDEGSYSEGIGLATRLLQLDPWQEEAHRAMMRLLMQSGQRGAALAQYEACRRVLGEELGIEPEDATVALYERIRDGVELRADESRRAAGPLRSARPQRALPRPTTSFVGREAELAQVLARLRDPDCRLLAIVGPGGIGKTRLALQVAHQLAAARRERSVFAHGVVFASLVGVEATTWAASADVEAAVQALVAGIVDALNLAFSGPAAPEVQVMSYLREKELLLVLDNIEHLLAAAEFLVELLEQAPGLKIVVTSRVRLNVRGEQIVELDGLSYPKKLGADVRAEWERYSALLLFLQRAQALHPRFAATAEDYAAIARICRLVEGLPLGIELASSWVRLLSCQEIAREIEANIGFLQTHQRAIPERHQSVRAIFDHSWNLLGEAEQHALRRLSVFRGGFGRAAAARVAGASLSSLMALIDNSLVRRAPDDGRAGVRYELLEVVRQYAAEKLVEAADAGENEYIAVRDRHCTYFMTYLQERKADLRGSRQQEALSEINQEIENIRAAWRWAVEQGCVNSIDRAVESLFHFYDMRSWFQEGATVFGQAAAYFAELHAREHSERARRVWGKLLARHGWFTFHVGRQSEAQALLEQSLAILRPLGVADELVFSLNYLAVVNAYLGAYEQARWLCQEGLAISQAGGDRYSVAIAKNILGQIAFLQGDYLEARRSCQESLAIEQEIGNRWSMTFSLTNLGNVAYALGDYEEARGRFRQSLAIRQALVDARGTALCLSYLGDTAEAQADYPEARRLYQASLSLFREIGNQWGAATALIKLGYNALDMDDRVAAKRYFLDALRTAMRTQAAPKMLDALTGIAVVMAEDAPEQALTLAALIRYHPAATKESKDRVDEVRTALSARLSLDPAAVQRHWEAEELHEIIAALVREE